MRYRPRAEMFADDGLHPSETSQRRLAKLIAAEMTPRIAGALRDSSRSNP
jgi:lysophospholipase L1-like esterase